MLYKTCAPGSWPADSFSVAAYSEVNPAFQPGEGRVLRIHCQRASPSLWDGNDLQEHSAGLEPAFRLE